MRTWLRSLIDVILGKVPGKASRLDTATRMAIDADFSDHRDRPGEARSMFAQRPDRRRAEEPRYRRRLLSVTLAISLAGQVGPALAYACNNKYYVNSSGHLVHSPSCGEEHEKRTAECRDGSVSYSEHHRGTCSYQGGVAHWD